MGNKIIQQKVADTVRQYSDAYIVGALNAYELAARILVAAREAEIDQMAEETDDHDCKLDKFGTGHCDHQCTSNCRREGCPCDEHDHNEVQTPSGAYRFAH